MELWTSEDKEEEIEESELEGAGQQPEDKQLEEGESVVEVVHKANKYLVRLWVMSARAPMTM